MQKFYGLDKLALIYIEGRRWRRSLGLAREREQETPQIRGIMQKISLADIGSDFAEENLKALDTVEKDCE